MSYPPDHDGYGARLVVHDEYHDRLLENFHVREEIMDFAETLQFHGFDVQVGEFVEATCGEIRLWAHVIGTHLVDVRMTRVNEDDVVIESYGEYGSGTPHTVESVDGNFYLPRVWAIITGNWNQGGF